MIFLPGLDSTHVNIHVDSPLNKLRRGEITALSYF